MNREPKISVIMSVFNGSKFLADAIKSILNQTFKEFELIIVDDGSTDNSLNIIRSFESADSRIKVISKLNEGAMGAKIIECCNKCFSRRFHSKNGC